MSTTLSYADFDRLKVGDSASCEMVVDEQSVQLFAALSGDDNALHLDAAVAQSCGFSRRVAHGMLALSAISRLIGTQLPGHGALWVSQELRFPTAALVGDVLTAQVSVEQLSRGAEIVKLKTEVRNQHTGAVVLTGSAMVKIPRRQKGAIPAA